MTLEKYKSELENYWKDPSINQSLLKKYLGHPRQFLRESKEELYFQEKKHFLRGSLTEMILFFPQFVKNFYYISELEKTPPDRVQSIIHQLVDEDIKMSNFDQVVRVCIDQDYTGNNWKEDTIYNKILAHLDYYEYLKDSDGKEIVSKEDYEIATKCAHGLASGKYTAKYFEPGDNIKMFPQHALYRKYSLKEEYSLKGLIDLMRIDEENEIIYLIDIKTTGVYLENFPDVIKRYNYDIQMSFYKKLIEAHYPDYEIITILLAVSTKEPEFAEPFKLEESLLEDVWYGTEDITGIIELLNKKSYYDKQGYFFTKELRENETNLITKNDLYTRRN